jgi:mannose-1-phosphate guanylyltransferase
LWSRFQKSLKIRKRSFIIQDKEVFIVLRKHRTSIEFPEDLWRQLSSRIPARRRTSFIIEAVREKLIRESMKCLILCGGLGIGMGPLSKSIPKAMMPVGYKPLLEHIICKLRDQGLNYFILAVSHLSEHIIRYFGDGGLLGVRIDYSVEKIPLGTAGAIKNAEDKLNGRFLVVYGDVLFDGLSIGSLLRFHEEKNAVATMALARVGDASRFGLVSLDEDGRVIAFREKPKQPVPGLVNAGIYVFEPEILEYIPELTYCSLEEHVFPALIERGKLYAYPYNGYWVDIGSPEDYEQAWKDYFTGVLG